MSFPNIIHMSEEETGNSYSTERYPAGSLAMIEDGRLYRFVENGGVAQVVGEMQQARLEVVADTTGQTVGTMAAGVLVLTGVGATNNNFAANILKYGYVFTDTAADANPAYRIKSNTLITAGASTGTITLYTPTRAAIAAATTLCFLRSPWRDTIVAVATTPTAMVLGAAVNAIAVDQYGWVCSRGPARVLGQGTLVIGDPCGPGTDAGSAAPISATELTVPVYGTVLKVEATTEKSLVFLQID